ncbi:MAG: DUF2203 domain-containing protein [Acidobacteria bacterium]|nr:MAG: DUF2203 domain-containing protein [Acidobacteriota bacterium]
MDDRIFTLAEAQALIPQLRSILEEIHQEWGRIKELNPEIQKARDKAPYNGFSKSGVTYVESVSHLMLLIHQIKHMGVVLKDVDKGLCDFPYMRQGRLVYLCWQLGEETIEYWHDIEAGFAGRERLDETDR